MSSSIIYIFVGPKRQGFELGFSAGREQTELDGADGYLQTNTRTSPAAQAEQALSRPCARNPTTGNGRRINKAATRPRLMPNPLTDCTFMCILQILTESF
jgi:hypothetical protein